MNIAKIAIDNFSLEEQPIDHSPFLRSREVDLVKTINALKHIARSEEWSVVKKLVFDGVVETLEQQLSAEAKKTPVEESKLYKLQGQLVWAKKYADLDSLISFFTNQLTSVKQQLHAQE